MTNILCVGVAVVDFVFYTDEFPTIPQKYRANDAAIVGGGGAANAAVAVARLGGQAYLSARVGDDQIGRMVVSDLEAEGVNCTPIQRQDGSRSGFSSVLIDAQGERQIMNFRGAGLAEEPGSPPENLNGVLADTRWPVGAIAALDHARTLGVPGVVDAEAPIDPGVLHAASHVAFSAQGLRSLAPEGTLSDALQHVSQKFDCWMAVTDGPDGVYFTDGDRIAHIPSFDIQVVDSLGAGDVWHGAFVLALTTGMEEVQAVQFASAAAAIKCTRPGGRAGTPTRAEVDDFLKERIG